MKTLRMMSVFVVILFVIGTIGADLAYAKGGGFSGGSRGGGFSSSRSSFSGGSRSSSSSSSRSGFSGGNRSSKPATSTGSSAKKADTSANPPAKAQTATQARQSRVVSKQQSAKALESFKAQRQQYKAQPSATASAPSTQAAVLEKLKPAPGAVITSKGFTSQRDYYSHRDNYYRDRGWSQPSYAYNYAPSFGMWDAMFLWMMLDTINDSGRNDAAMYYNHQNDPAMQEWRANAEKEAANNEELKTKLAALDAKVKEMEAQGVQRDESYIPPDAGAAVLASEVAEQNLVPATEAELRAEKKSELKQEDNSGSKLGWILYAGAMAVLFIGGIVVYKVLTV